MPGKARDKEQETLALYQLTSRLTEAKDLEEIAGIIVTAAGNRFFMRGRLSLL